MAKAKFPEALAAATLEAFEQLRELIKRETLYTFALYTSGESDFSYVCASGNTEQKQGKDKDTRWSAPDWHYHDFSERVGGLELPKGSGEKRDQAIYEAMVSALLPLRKKAKGVTLLILCGDMSDAFFRRGLERLNAKDVVKAYLADDTPEAFLKKLDAMPAKKRLPVVLQLWRDLILEHDAPLANAARRAGAHEWVVDDRIVALGRPAVPTLFEYMEEFAFAPPFNKKGTPQWERHGACTRESHLATRSRGLIQDIGKLTEAEVARLQRLLAKRAAADARVRGHVSTLTENIARMLHELFPARFPESKLNPNTNHLMNPKPFLPAG